MEENNKPKEHTTVARMEKGSIKRVLNLGDLFAIGYGDLGSSIYYALGITALYALGATPIALALAGIVFICTALSYAELSAMYPESGGSATFARHAFNDTASFVAGWGLLLDYIVTIAISAFAIGPYLSNLFKQLNDIPTQIVFTLCIIAALFVINFVGVKRSTRLSLLLAIVALFTQVAIIITGIFLLSNFPRIWEQLKIGVPGVEWSPSWPSFLHGIAMAMVAYTGIESIAQLGAESRRPSKDLPRAIVLNIVTLLALYMGLAIVGLSALTPKELGTDFSSDPLSGIVQEFHVTNTFFVPWVGWVAAILLFSAANTGLIGSSRLAVNLGEYYQLPRFFSKINSKFHTPALSLIFFAALAAALVVLSGGRLTFLADLYNFGAMIAFFSVNVSLLKLRFKRPKENRPFKVGLSIRIKGYQFPITAVVGAVSTLAVWVLIVITKPYGRYLGLSWMVFGVLVFYLYRRKKNLPITGSLALHKVRVEKRTVPSIKNILVPIQNIGDSEIIFAACEVAKSKKASLTILHVIEVPNTLPLDSLMHEKLMDATTLLRYAEAIIREHEIPMTHVILRGRSFSEVLSAALKGRKWELVVIPGRYWDRRTSTELGHLLHEKIFQVWICY